MCFLLPALTGARGSGEGRESRKYCSGAGRGCRRAQPFLCCAHSRTLPTAPVPERSPRGPARAAWLQQPRHSLWLKFASPAGRPGTALRRVLGWGGWVPAVPRRSQLQQEAFLLAPLLETSRGGIFP